MNHAWRRRAAALLLGACLAAGAGCEKEPQTPDEALGQLTERIEPKLRPGWKISRVKDAPFAVRPEKVDAQDLTPYVEAPAGDDLLVWKAQPVALQDRPGADLEANPGHLYFVLSPREFIEPGDYAARARTNEEAIEKRRHLLRDVANVPRDADGRLRARGAAESEQIAAFRKKYDAMPPYEAFLPTHYFGRVGIRLRDYRTTLVPVEREDRQDVNQMYVEIIQILSEYGR